MEHLLIVKEMNNRFFDNALREDLLLEAITSVSAGMDYDYERLELLGNKRIFCNWYNARLNIPRRRFLFKIPLFHLCVCDQPNTE